ncbi:MAG: hypothetical protein ABEJ57_01680 [Halobacteriaceae archaeon]
MGKVSIALEGWRFDEDALFDDNGEFRPLSDLDPDTRKRLVRLTSLRGEPCDACWLIHGDEAIQQCNVAGYVYGEPMAEVLLCEDHVDDFYYWYQDDGGAQYRGTEVFQDRFHEWFAEGNRAPDDYAGVEHERTAPEDVPRPREPEPGMFTVKLSEDERVEIDLLEALDDADQATIAELDEALDDDLNDALEDL